MGLFERYAADTDMLRTHAGALERQMQLLTLLRGEISGKAKQALADVEGDLKDPMVRAPVRAQGDLDRVVACGYLAAGCLHRWAGGVDTYNAVVDRVNRTWDAAVADDRHVPEGLGLEETTKRTADVVRRGKVPVMAGVLRWQVDRAHEELDEVARNVAGTLQKGPDQASLQNLIDSGDLPPSTALVVHGYHLGMPGIPAPVVDQLRKAMDRLPPAVRYLLEGLVNIPGDLEKVLRIAGSPQALIDALLDKQARAEFMDAAMRDPDIARDIYTIFGFEYHPDGDYYTTGEHSMQSLFGFNTRMDEVGPLLGMDLQDQQIYYTGTDGHQYRLELWKGSYGFGSSYGGEQGLYRAPDPGDHSSDPNYTYSTVQGPDQVHFTQSIVDKRTGQVMFTNDAHGADGTDKNHYWNLAIRSDPGMSKEDIEQRGQIIAQDEQTAQAIYQAMQQKAASDPSIHDVQYDPQTHAVTYVWD